MTVTNPRPIDTPGDPPPPPPAPPVAPPSPPAPAPIPVAPAPPPPVPLPALPRPTLPAPPAPTGTPRYSIDDYAGAAAAMMPRGRVWQDDPASVQGRVMQAIAGSCERVDASGCSILDGSLPGSPLSGFLPEWEATLGLPDPCIGTTPTFAQRFDQVLARFTGVGGQSRPRFIDYAASLGFEISITNYAPFRVGHSAVGQPLASDAWTFVWGVTVLANPGGLSADVLMCELNAIKPAETTVILL